MKKGTYPYLLATLLAFIPASSMAAEWTTHPILSDDFMLSVGAFQSSNSLKFQANSGQDIGDEIDFGDKFGVDDSGTLVDAQLRWRFGSTRKWSIWGQYFSSNGTGTSVLDQDIEWQGLTFGEGTFASAGVGFDLVRAFIGRSFLLNDKQDFGVGIGAHYLNLDAFVEGELIVNDTSTGVRRADASADQVLPNIGLWYNFSPASRWLLHARIDWFSANISDYDGTLWNTSAGVNFQAWRHIGFDLSWQYFSLDVNVDKTDWDGGAELSYSGPVLSVTATW